MNNFELYCKECSVYDVEMDARLKCDPVGVFDGIHHLHIYLKCNRCENEEKLGVISI